MIKKSIAITEQQNEWIKALMAQGAYGNESEFFRDMIRERQLRERETPSQIAEIRKKLLEAEKSGFTDQTVDEIWEEARREAKGKNA